MFKGQTRTMASQQLQEAEEDCGLTVFGPVPESPETSFSWSNFFKWSGVQKVQAAVNKHGSAPAGLKGFHYNTKHGRVVEIEQSDQTVDDSRSASKNLVRMDSEVRTKRFSNVMRKISSALDRSASSTSTQYSDHDFKQYWMPDSDCKECYDCGDRFTTFRRRHHCRICGQVFCSSCCNQEIPGKLIGCRVDLRVCIYCCKVVLSCIQSTESMAESSIDFKILHDQLLARLGMTDNQSNSSSCRPKCRKTGVAFSEYGFNHAQAPSNNSQDRRYSETATDEDQISRSELSTYTTDSARSL